MSTPSEQSLSHLLRDARRARGITQQDLAKQADCTQSAISMMEKGKTDALARPTLEKIASILGVELPADEPSPTATAVTSVPHPARICPNDDCPGNLPYRVGDELHFLPHAHDVPGSRCPYCGEVLISVCPECGAPIHAGEAVCTLCGAPLVPHVATPSDASDEWLQTRQRQSQLLREWK